MLMKDFVQEGEATNSSAFLQWFKVELVKQSRYTGGVVGLPLNSLERFTVFGKAQL